MSAWTPLGPHRYRIEGDVFFWCPGGEVTPEHATSVCQIFDLMQTQHGYILWLIDATLSIPLPPDSRRIYAQWMSSSNCRLSVNVFQTSVAARTMADLVIRGVRLRAGVEVTSHVYTSELEARAGLVGERARFLAATSLLTDSISA